MNVNQILIWDHNYCLLLTFDHKNGSSLVDICASRDPRRLVHFALPDDQASLPPLLMDLHFCRPRECKIKRMAALGQDDKWGSHVDGGGRYDLACSFRDGFPHRR